LQAITEQCKPVTFCVNFAYFLW